MTFRIGVTLESLQYLDNLQPQRFDFCIECKQGQIISLSDELLAAFLEFPGVEGGGGGIVGVRSTVSIQDILHKMIEIVLFVNLF